MRAIDFTALVAPGPGDPNLKPAAQAISAFARANGWEYYVGSGEQPWTGVVFRDAQGRPRHLQRAGSIVRTTGQAPVEIGNSAYSVTVNLNVTSVAWGYATVPLAVPAPALVLESDRNRAHSPLPALPVGAAQVRVGGAERAASVHCEPAAASWVSAVFTDDVCALLDDGALAFDVEIVPGRLFLYAPGELSTAAPAVWARTFAALEALQARLHAHPWPGAQTPLPMRDGPWRVARRRSVAYFGAAAVGSVAVAAAVAVAALLLG